MSEIRLRALIVPVGNSISAVGKKIPLTALAVLKDKELHETTEKPLGHKQVISVFSIRYKVFSGADAKKDKTNRTDRRRDGNTSPPRRMSGAPQGPNPRCAAKGKGHSLYMLSVFPYLARFSSMQR